MAWNCNGQPAPPNGRPSAGQEDGKAGSTSPRTYAASQTNRPTVFLNKAADDPESQSGSFTSFGAEERFKDLFVPFCRYSRPVIGDYYSDPRLFPIFPVTASRAAKCQFSPTSFQNL